VYRVQFEVAETTEQVFVGPDSIFIIINPIPYDFLHLVKHFSKTKYLYTALHTHSAGYLYQYSSTADVLFVHFEVPVSCSGAV